MQVTLNHWESHEMTTNRWRVSIETPTFYNQIKKFNEYKHCVVRVCARILQCNLEETVKYLPVEGCYQDRNHLFKLWEKKFIKLNFRERGAATDDNNDNDK